MEVTSTCKEFRSIRTKKKRQLIEITSPRWLELLTLKEHLHLAVVAKECDGWITSASHVLHTVVIHETPSHPKQQMIRNFNLRKVLHIAGPQLRILRLEGLSKIDGYAFNVQQGFPLLQELHIVGKSGISSSGKNFVQVFFQYTHPFLKTVRLSGCLSSKSNKRNAGLTAEHMDTIHNSGVTVSDVFTCQCCAAVSLEQAQCVFRSCQPSTVALCTDCATTYCCSAGTTSCHRFGCSECTFQYREWAQCTSCSKHSCGACREIQHCASCNVDCCTGCSTVHDCHQCERSFCTNDCKLGGQTCDICERSYCYECRRDGTTYIDECCACG